MVPFKCQVEISTIIDAIVFLRHYKKLNDMVFSCTNQRIYPRGFTQLDFDKTMQELEEVKITAKEACPQLRVEQ